MTLVIAHRGASAEEPENSLAAFRRAVEQRADGIELDVHVTADGELVVRHDAAIAGQAIARLSLREIRMHQLPNGEPIPTLSEALQVIGPDTVAFVEIKQLSARHDARLLETLSGSNGRWHVHSFDHRIIHRLQPHCPRSQLGVLSASYPVHPVSQMNDAGAGELWQDGSLLDAALVDEVHQAGGRVYAWTVDEPAWIRELAALGVDGICTNHPARTRQALP